MNLPLQCGLAQQFTAAVVVLLMANYCNQLAEARNALHSQLLQEQLQNKETVAGLQQELQLV